MCTVVVSIGSLPEATIRLAGVRDEFADRPWEGPGEHWPDHPGVVGGRDLKAGGTWLAVSPATRRAAALLNGVGVEAPQESRLTRGDLPLNAVDTGDLPEVDLARYDPFHLLLAQPSGVRLWSWDGRVLTDQELTEGTHMIVNTGWEREGDNARVREFLPRFAAADDWHELVDGAAPPSDDPGALLVRHELPDGRVFASLSVTLLTLATDGVTYDFGDLKGWTPVKV